LYLVSNHRRHHYHHHHQCQYAPAAPASLTLANAHSSSSSQVGLSARSPTPLLTHPTGYPSAGKTTRAVQLKSYFDDKIAAANDKSATRLKVHIVNDQTLGVSRAVYHTARAEKDARAEEYSAVKRILSRDDIVIADGLNYIKGFRYQLYCEAKALQTPSCVVSALHYPPCTCADRPRGAHRNPRRQVSPIQHGPAG
jgi:hypothetical protein